MLLINNIQNINPTIKNNSRNIRFCSKSIGVDKFSTSSEVCSNSDFSASIKEKFSQKQLDKLSKKTTEFIQKVDDLSITRLSGDNILSALKYANFSFDFKKLATKVLDMEDFCGNNLNSIELSNNKYVEKSLDINAILKNGTKRKIVLDENLNKTSIQEISYKVKNGQKYEVKKEKDFKNGITSKVVSKIVNENVLPIPISELILTKDYKQISVPSPIKGVFNTKRIYKNGKVQQISSGLVDEKTGIKTVKKDMYSLDGTHTQYEYSNDPNGNKIVDYKITDKNGKVLYKNSEAFEVIDENTFISSKNDKSYLIKYSDNDNKLSVKDNDTKEITEIDLHMFIYGSKDKLIPALKKVSGDELIKMSKNVNRLFQQDDQTTSCYKPTEKDVITCGNDYILVHELGHAKDMKNYDTSSFKTKDATEHLLISASSDFLDVYSQEKKLFNEKFSTNQREHIDYFISGTNKFSSSRSEKEAVAEINAILNSCNDVEKYSLRSEYLQMYFPKTISKLAEIL